MADISRLVNVQTRIVAPGGTSVSGFGTVLLVTEDDLIAAEGQSDRVRSFRALDTVGAGFGTTAEAYEAAEVYFSQSPYPRPLKIAHWQRVAVSGRLTSGTFDASQLSTLRGLTALTILGQSITTSFGNADSLSVIAGKLQTALRTNSNAGLVTATVTSDNNRLIIDFSGGVDGAYAGGSNAASWRMTQATSAEIRSAVSAESFEAMIAAVNAVDSDWSMITLTEGLSVATAIEDMSSWAQAQESKLCAFGFDALMEAPPANADGATQTRYSQFLRDAGRSRSIACHAPSFQYIAVSALALFAGVDYEQAASHLTLAWKSLPSILPDDTLTEAQLDQLDDERVNYYTTYGGAPRFQRGVTSDPNVYADERFWLDWFALTVRNDVFDLLSSSPALPLDSVGLGAIESVVDDVCRLGIRNGGMSRRGTVSQAVRAVIAQATGNAGFAGNLPHGYLIYIPPATELTPTQRAGREAPPIRLWLLGSDAIQRATFQVDFV